jgi:hypothetical protein
METVKNEQYSLEKFNVFMIKCFLVKEVKKLFLSKPRFSDMTSDARKFIAGIHNKHEIPKMREMLANAGKTVEPSGKVRYVTPKSNSLVPAGTFIGTCFGNMRGNGVFQQKINNENISLALDQIPLSGDVTKQHYLNFWEYYASEFGTTYIGTATRLLCMKRPDFFICVNSANKKNLCDAFGLSVSKFNKDIYWETILSQIFESDWYRNSKIDTENAEEKLVYGARVAFLDAVYYKLAK